MNRYFLLTGITIAGIFGILAVSFYSPPANLPPAAEPWRTPEELGFHEHGPRPNLFSFRTLSDPAQIFTTECPQWDGRTVRLRPGTTVPIKSLFVSKVDYDLDVTFNATLRPSEGVVEGVSLYFDKPSVIVPPKKAVTTTLFLEASEDVGDSTTILVFHVAALAVPNPLYGLSTQGDVLYVMIGDQPNEPQMFVFYPSVLVNGSLLYRAGEEPPDNLYLRIDRGGSLDITISVFVKSNATYPIEITATDSYFFPKAGVTSAVTPRSAIVRTGDTIEFTISVSIDEEFVALPEDYWSADEPMHGQDLYMLIQLLDVPDDANAGWCKFVNLPHGIGADYVLFNVG